VLAPDALLDAARLLHSTLPPAGVDPALASLGQETTVGECATNGTATAAGANATATNATTTAGVACTNPEAWWEFGWLKAAVETATGWVGLGIIAVYSFLIAFVLPLPSEVVLAAPLDLGLTRWSELGLIILVSSAGKAAGSLFAFHLGQEAKEAGPVIRFLRRSRFDVVQWSEAKTVEIARKYGYVGLALALCVPGFPDTLSIYAFSVLDENYAKFALATFVGSVGRLVLWTAGAKAILTAA
jgi:membrane protein YqaA with SNARE-associated domain